MGNNTLLGYWPDYLILPVSLEGVWPVGISQVGDSDSPHTTKGKLDQETSLRVDVGHLSQSSSTFLQLSYSCNTTGIHLYIWSSSDGPSLGKTTKASPTCERQHEARRFGAGFYHLGIYCLTHLKHTLWVGCQLEKSRIYRRHYNQQQWIRTEDGWRILIFQTCW